MAEIKKIFCNTCKNETNHDLLSFHDRNYYEEAESDGQSYLHWYERWRYGFWACRGCDTATLEERYTFSGMNDSDGNEIYDYTHFPERSNEFKRKPQRFIHIDKKLNSIYKEIVTAYQNGLEIVCAMGIRALLEGVCVAEGVEDKKAWGLNKKIEKLQSLSNIPPGIIDGLKSLKFIGDDAAHRLKPASKNSIDLSIDLLEALLTHLYEAKFELQYKADLIKKAHNKTNSVGVKKSNAD